MAVAQLKVNIWKAKAESYQRDAFMGIQARENWVIFNECLLQCNNGSGEGGCKACNIEDFEETEALGFCPFKD